MGDTDEPAETGRALFIFGRDVSKIPCFRESFLYGMGTGMGVGLMAFMGTSQPRIGSHVGMGTFLIFTMSYWCYCRYQWSKQKFLVMQVQEGMRRRALYEGTDLDREMKARFKEEDA